MGTNSTNSIFPESLWPKPYLHLTFSRYLTTDFSISTCSLFNSNLNFIKNYFPILRTQFFTYNEMIPTTTLVLSPNLPQPTIFLDVTCLSAFSFFLAIKTLLLKIQLKVISIFPQVMIPFLLRSLWWNTSQPPETIRLYSVVLSLPVFNSVQFYHFIYVCFPTLSQSYQKARKPSCSSVPPSINS